MEATKLEMSERKRQLADEEAQKSRRSPPTACTLEQVRAARAAAQRQASRLDT